MEPVPAGGHGRNGSGYHGAGLTNPNTPRWPKSWAACPGPARFQLLGARHRQHGNHHATARRPIKATWLEPLLEGKIRSAFAMTEPGGGLQRRHQHRGRIERQGDEYVINGRKWWTSGAGGPALQDLIIHGQDRSRKRRATRSSR